MAEILDKKRNNTVDIIRGLAMLLVVLGHTITGSTKNGENSFVYNIIWTLQMPLFMLIIGYVNKYSKPITDFKSLGSFFLKRLRAYILPFAVWTFIIRGIIFKQTGYLNIKNLIFNMDNGYWFLFSIFNIAIIIGIADFLSYGIFKKQNEYVKLTIKTFFYVLGMCSLAVVGYFMGLSFLCIKLTLYYMPFYYVGYLYSKFDTKFNEIKFFKISSDIVIALSFVLWIFLMKRYNFFEIGDSGFGIMLRALASMLGCISVCGLVCPLVVKTREKSNKSSKIFSLFEITGRYSLEIYLSHYLVLSMIKPENLPAFQTLSGVTLTVVNYVLTILVVTLIVLLINSNKILRGLCFGKK